MNNNNINYSKVIDYCIKNEIIKIVMFIKDEKNILKFKRVIDESGTNIELCGITFPANEHLITYDAEEKEVKELIPEASAGNKVQETLAQHDIRLITSTLPFEGIVIPGDNFNPYKIIEKTLGIIDGSLPSLVQSVIVATDNGFIKPSERVLALNLYLAVDTIGTNTRFLFHPKKGMRINEIIKKESLI